MFNPVCIPESGDVMNSANIDPLDLIAIDYVVTTDKRGRGVLEWEPAKVGMLILVDGVIYRSHESYGTSRSHRCDSCFFRNAHSDCEIFWSKPFNCVSSDKLLFFFRPVDEINQNKG